MQQAPSTGSKLMGPLLPEVSRWVSLNSWHSRPSPVRVITTAWRIMSGVSRTGSLVGRVKPTKRGSYLKFRLSDLWKSLSKSQRIPRYCTEREVLPDLLQLDRLSFEVHPGHHELAAVSNDGYTVADFRDSLFRVRHKRMGRIISRRDRPCLCGTAHSHIFLRASQPPTATIFKLTHYPLWATLKLLRRKNHPAQKERC
jgi:hypothetical protein